MADITTCPLCRLSGIRVSSMDTLDQSVFIECGRCGKYQITTWCILRDQAKLEQIGYALSGLARELSLLHLQPPNLTTENLDELISKYPVPDLGSIEGKARKVLDQLKRWTTYYSEAVRLTIATDYSIAYAKNPDEFSALLDLLSDQGHITILARTNGDIDVKLSANGWRVAQSLDPTNDSSNQGFIAAWFHESTKDSIGTMSDTIKEMGFTPFCIQNEHFSEKIIDKALAEIRGSRFVVVDLTGARSSVFFEAGFATGLGIDTIFVINEQQNQKNSGLEFYVKHYQCHSYHDQTELKVILTNAIGARIKRH